MRTFKFFYSFPFLSIYIKNPLLTFCIFESIQDHLTYLQSVHSNQDLWRPNLSGKVSVFLAHLICNGHWRGFHNIPGLVMNLQPITPFRLTVPTHHPPTNFHLILTCFSVFRCQIILELVLQHQRMVLEKIRR